MVYESTSIRIMLRPCTRVPAPSPARTILHLTATPAGKSRAYAKRVQFRIVISIHPQMRELRCRLDPGHKKKRPRNQAARRIRPGIRHESTNLTGHTVQAGQTLLAAILTSKATVP